MFKGYASGGWRKSFANGTKAQLRVFFSFRIITVVYGHKGNAASTQLELKCKLLVDIVSFGSPCLIMKVILKIAVPKTFGKEIESTV